MADDVVILEKATPFQGYFRIDRYTLQHRTHDGGMTSPMVREIFERGHAVAILLYDPLRDEIGLIEQFRPGALAAGWHPWLIEIVAGIIDEGETPEQVAIRETREEAGVTVDRLVHICDYLVTPGGSSESIRLYYAEIDASTLSGIHGLPEEGEDIRVFSVPANEAFSWLSGGKPLNSTLLIALQWLMLNHGRLCRKHL